MTAAGMSSPRTRDPSLTHLPARHRHLSGAAPDASRVALGTDEGTVAVVDTAAGRHIDTKTEERL
jgi:hypothetical protein